MRGGRNPSPAFGHIGANDSPKARCSDGHVYNPYKHSECPECHPDYSNDVPVVDPSDYTDE